MQFDYRLLKRRIRKVFGTEDKFAEAMSQKPASITLRQKAFGESQHGAGCARDHQQEHEGERLEKGETIAERVAGLLGDGLVGRAKTDGT